MEQPPRLIAAAKLADELAVFLEQLRRTTEALEAALREAEQVSGRRRPVSGENRAA